MAVKFRPKTLSPLVLKGNQKENRHQHQTFSPTSLRGQIKRKNCPPNGSQFGTSHLPRPRTKQHGQRPIKYFAVRWILQCFPPQKKEHLPNKNLPKKTTFPSKKTHKPPTGGLVVWLLGASHPFRASAPRGEVTSGTVGPQQQVRARK